MERFSTNLLGKRPGLKERADALGEASPWLGDLRGVVRASAGADEEAARVIEREELVEHRLGQTVEGADVGPNAGASPGEDIDATVAVGVRGRHPNPTGEARG